MENYLSFLVPNQIKLVSGRKVSLQEKETKADYVSSSSDLSNNRTSTITFFENAALIKKVPVRLFYTARLFDRSEYTLFDPIYTRCLKITKTADVIINVRTTIFE